jgi:site-specific DNA recombinase
MKKVKRRDSTAPHRAALYLRVSSQEQVEGYSLDAQLRANRDFCATRGWQVVTVYSDEGVSAHTDNLAKRPEFARMLADADTDQFEVIVVHNMDRFARKLQTCLACLERLGTQGVGVTSVSEPDLDYSTPQGFLFLSMLGALAEWFSRNLSQETRKGWAERSVKGSMLADCPMGP